MLYAKTLIVKASYATSALAQASTAMKTIVTDFVSNVRSVAVWLNCDASGVAALDVDIQVTPDAQGTAAGSIVWYTAGQFTQVNTEVSYQVKQPTAVGAQMRAYPSLGGLHNFGVRVTFDAGGGFVSADTA